MVQCNTCLLGFTLLLSSIYMSILKQDQDIFIKFFNLLDSEQQMKYTQIVKERVTIYVTGMVAGLVSGFYYYKQNQNQPYIICTFLAIVYSVKLLFYYFYPKSPLMLYSLKTKEQTDAWATIYEEMKYRYKMSLLVGFIGYLLLFSGLK